MESYSQLQEAAKQIIARVAGRLSGTVGRSGLMDPAVTRLERAAVVSNTPITFRPRELLGVCISAEYIACSFCVHIFIASSGKILLALCSNYGEPGVLVIS